jgi:hypothetical protein
MEVLLSSENNLSTDEINWAIRNIPNDEQDIAESEFDHEKDDLFEACGISKKEKNQIIEEYISIKKHMQENLGSTRNSMLIEAVLKCGSATLIKAFFIRGIMGHEKGGDDFMKRLKDLFSRLSVIYELLVCCYWGTGWEQSGPGTTIKKFRELLSLPTLHKDTIW